jgi:sensor domain CHASE-containing protein
MKIDLKASVLLGALLLAVVSYFYYYAIDMNVLELKVQALQTENNHIRKRLDMIDNDIDKTNRRVWTIKNERK